MRQFAHGYVFADAYQPPHVDLVAVVAPESLFMWVQHTRHHFIIHAKILYAKTKTHTCARRQWLKWRHAASVTSLDTAKSYIRASVARHSQSDTSMILFAIMHRAIIRVACVVCLDTIRKSRIAQSASLCYTQPKLTAAYAAEFTAKKIIFVRYVQFGTKLA